jgi:asparagine synthase (glutamine-hydrolysing)
MCAIAGEVVLTRDQRVRLDALAPMIGALRHRGPDDWGCWTSPDATVALLNARLAIVDREGGHQPLANEDETVWVTFNGELYGFERLARDLVRRGHHLRTRSDTEVIVHLYEEYGERFIDHLRGEFALALHDVRRRVTYLVRDRFGIKPLFYATAGHSLVFASEMKGLFAYPSLTPRLDPEQIFHLLGGVFLPGHTLFSGVRQVRPGSFVRIQGGTVSTIRYWELAISREVGAAATGSDGPGRDDRAIVEEFAHKFEESVTIRLRGDVEAAVYLSGGVDSASVARVMADVQRPLKAFTVGFAHQDYDETAPSAAAASQLHVEHHVARLGPGDLATPFVDALWHAEAPIINAHAAAKYALSELAGRHVKVVLTGEGADELLAGYPQFRHQQLLDRLRRHPGDRETRAELGAFLARSGTLAGTIPIDRYPDLERVTRLFGAYPYPLAKTVYYQRRLWALLSAPLRRQARTLDSLEALAPLLDRTVLADLPAVAASQYVLFETELPGYILSSLGDRMEMAHSVEGRTPFLDHELVELVNRLPLRFKLRGAVDKWVLREAMAPRLPAVSMAPKRVFMAPSLSTLGLDTRESPLDAWLNRRLIEEAGIFNPTAVAALRLGARLLPRGSRAQLVCESATVLALSLHILYALFCRDFRGSLARYRRQADVEADAGAAVGTAAVTP